MSRTLVKSNDKFSIFSAVDEITRHTQTSTKYENGQPVVATYDVPKYNLIEIVKNDTQEVVFQYKQYIPHSTRHYLFVQNGVNYYLGSLEYQSQLFVNLDTNEYYDNCKYLDGLSDNGYVRMNKCYDNPGGGFGKNEGFIWCDVQFYSDYNFAIVGGCYWANPHEVIIVDISDIKNGWNSVEDTHVKINGLKIFFPYHNMCSYSEKIDFRGTTDWLKYQGDLSMQTIDDHFELYMSLARDHNFFKNHNNELIGIKQCDNFDEDNSDEDDSSCMIPLLSFKITHDEEHKLKYVVDVHKYENNIDHFLKTLETERFNVNTERHNFMMSKFKENNLLTDLLNGVQIEDIEVVKYDENVKKFINETNEEAIRICHNDHISTYVNNSSLIFHIDMTNIIRDDELCDNPIYINDNMCVANGDRITKKQIKLSNDTIRNDKIKLQLARLFGLTNCNFCQKTPFDKNIIYRITYENGTNIDITFTYKIIFDEITQQMNVNRHTKLEVIIELY